MSYPEPVYHGETGEISATYVPATAPADLVSGDTQTRYLATGASTDGHLGLYRVDMGPEAKGPGPHFHRTMSESFFVLSGTLRLYGGEKWFDATAGDFLHVPEGGLHGFTNESGQPVSLLLLFIPGAPREAYFEGLAEIARSGHRPSKEEMAEFFRRHDNHFV